ncbi:unnamed protein product, partial [marine sediment metagenome]
MDAKNLVSMLEWNWGDSEKKEDVEVKICVD